MSSSLRFMPVLRAVHKAPVSTRSAAQATRRLHITGAKDSPSQLLKPSDSSSTAARSSLTRKNDSRTFNTTRALKRPGDSSTIDFTFLPDAAALEPGMVSTAAMNIPILPDTYNPGLRRKSNAKQTSTASINTVSMSMPGQVAILSEVEVATQEGREMDIFKVVEQVSRSVAGSVKGAVDGVATEASVVKEVWEGMLGDLVRGRERAA